MSALVEIQEKLQDTTAALARLEMTLAAHPQVTSLALEYKSLERFQKQLEDEFSSESVERGLEICSYRLIPEEDGVKVSGLSSTIGVFQQLFSIFYDAIKNGPKPTAQLRPGIASETAMAFGYTYSGSVGVMFTVATNSDLFGDSVVDDSIGTIFAASRSRTPEQLLDFVRRYGVGPIRVLYKWAESHAKNSLSVNIEWRKGSVVKNKALIQKAEFLRLRNAIGATSPETTEEIEIRGTLVGAEVEKKTFHLKGDDGAHIRGTSGSIIGPDQSRLPG